MGVGGHIWVLLDALGSRDMGGTKNNRKRNKNDRVVFAYFFMHVREKTKQEVDRDG